MFVPYALNLDDLFGKKIQKKIALAPSFDFEKNGRGEEARISILL